jgi:pilus assembly protein TadC
MMLIILSLLVFICVACTLSAVAVAFANSKAVLRKRLMRAIATEPATQTSDYDEVVNASDRVLRFLLRLVAIEAHPRSAGLRKMEHRIGLLVALLLAGCLAATVMQQAIPILRLFGGAGKGLYGLGFWIGMRLAASFWIDWHRKRRIEDIDIGLIDTLDMWVLCLGAGMSFQSAMVRVGQDEVLGSPALREEMKLTIQEMLAGCPREDALRHLVRRCGDPPEMKALVSQIIQAERMGTSLSDTLRVFSDSLRFKRRQDTQEMIQQLSVKLAFPLIFFILPALFVVILTPSIIRFVQVLLR